MVKEKFYLNGLDSLRAIAALSVIVHHIEKNKPSFGSLHLSHAAEPLGHLGVVLFFTLSGFLITLLLLKEKKAYGSIDFKKFYLRRIFRIWPLYYMTILLSALLPGPDMEPLVWVLCLTILPNIATALLGGWQPSPQIWSIGVEEQFYLGWPFIINRFYKKLILVLVTLFLVFSLVPQVVLYAINRNGTDIHLINNLNHILFYSKFQCMMAGGIAGSLFFSRAPGRDKKLHPMLAGFAFIVPLACWFSGFTLPVFNDELYSILFALMMYQLASGNIAFFKKDPPLLSFLGKISYGLYMYHWMVISFCLWLTSDLFAKNVYMGNLVLYVSSLLLVILVSWISYRYFESFFLKKKELFTRNAGLS